MQGFQRPQDYTTMGTGIHAERPTDGPGNATEKFKAGQFLIKTKTGQLLIGDPSPGIQAVTRQALKLGQLLQRNNRAAYATIPYQQVVATADQHADQLAVFGIDYALEVLRTKAAPADRETPVDLVTTAK